MDILFKRILAISSIILIFLSVGFLVLNNDKKESQADLKYLVNHICKNPSNFVYKEDDIVSFHCKKKIMVVKTYRDASILLRTEGNVK